MITKLMRMEERIVLDGAVAAAATGTEGNAVEASSSQAPDGIAPLADIIDEDLTPGNEIEETEDLTALASQSMGAEDNPDSIEAENVMLAMEEALDNIENLETNSDSLRALIVNTNLFDSADLIDAAADDIIIITYDNDTPDMQYVINELDNIAGEREYESIALATHSGAGGEIMLTDSQQISAQSLSATPEQLAFFTGIGELLTTDGRLDLLSCYSGLGEAGDELITAIEEITGAEVAASIDATGNAEAGGDWILEKGDIEVSSIYFDDVELDNYTSTLNTELQALLGEINVDTDQQFGEEMDYFDGSDNDTDDGLLAVLAEGSEKVYLYRNSASGFTHETTIIFETTTNPMHIAVASNINGEYLVVSGENESSQGTVYVFEEDATNGWDNINSSANASSSDSTLPDGSDLSLDALGNTIIVGSPEANSYSGKVIIYELGMNSNTTWDLGNCVSAVLLPVFDSTVIPKPTFGNAVKLVDVDNDGDADQAFMTSANGCDGDDGDGVLGIKDGVYLSKSSDWGIVNGGTSAQSINVTRSNAVFETTTAVNSYLAGDVGKTDNIEVIAYTPDSGTTYYEDIFISFNNTTDSNYGVAIHSGTVNMTTYAFTPDGVPDFASITVKTGNVTFASHLCTDNDGNATDDGDRLLAVGTKYVAEEIGRIDIYRNTGSSWTKETGTALVGSLTPPDTVLTDSGFGSGLHFSNDTTILSSAPSYEGGVFDYRELKQGVYKAGYSGSIWGTAGPAGTYIADKIISSTDSAYLENFASHVSVDEGIAVVSTDSADDGILVYTYNETASEWDYIAKLEFEDLTTDLGGCCFEIWDLEVSGSSVIASVHSDSEKELIYVFDGVSTGRADPYETDTLAYTNYDLLVHSKAEFGRNINMQGGVIFATYTFENSSTDYNSAVLGYYHSGDDWGDAYAGSNLENQNIACTTSSNYDLMFMNADSASVGGGFNIIVSNYKDSDNSSMVTLFENVTSVFDGTARVLTFDATLHGGEASSYGFGSNVAINNDTIAIGVQGYATATRSDAGALAIYQADGSGNWAAGQASLTAVLTLDHSESVDSYFLGRDDIVIGDHSEVLALAGSNAVSAGYTYGWEISAATETDSTVERLSSPDKYDDTVTNTTVLSSLAYSTTKHHLFVGNNLADKGVTDVGESGVAYIYNVTNYNDPAPNPEMVITPAYATGSAIGDLGNVIINFNEPAMLANPGSGLDLVFTNTATSQETTVNLTEAETNLFFDSSHVKMTLALNNSKFDFIESSTQYSLYIADSSFKDSVGDVGESAVNYLFTVNSEFQRLIGKDGSDIDADYGTHVATDNDLAVITTNDASDGIFVYQHNISTHLWGYTATLEFTDLAADLGNGNYEIWDLAINGTTVIASVHSTTDQQELVYVFDDVGSGRANPYETDILYLSSSDANFPTDDLKNDFGRDIDIEDGAIFASNYYHGNTSGDPSDDALYSLVYLYREGVWGIGSANDSIPQTHHISYRIESTANYDRIYLDGDQIGTTDHYNLAVSLYNSTTNASNVYVTHDLAYGDSGSDTNLSFYAGNHGATSNSSGFGSSIAINDNIIAVGAKNYTTATHPNTGAIAIYTADSNGFWQSSENSLTAVLTLDQGKAVCDYNLGGSNLLIGDNSEVLATAGYNTDFHTYGWNIVSAISTNESIEIMSSPDQYNSSDDDSTPISSISFSNETNSLFVGNNLADKDATDVINTGVVSIFNVTNSTTPETPETPDTPYMTPPATSYIPGSTDGDMGEYIIGFSEPTSIITANGSLWMEFYNMNTSQSTSVEFTANEADQLFNTNHTQLTFNFNDPKFSFVTDNSHYSIYIPQNTFEDSSGGTNPDISYMLTVTDGEVVITPPDPIDDPFSDPSFDPYNDPYFDPMNDPAFDPAFDPIGDFGLGDLTNMLGDGFGGGLDSLLGMGNGDFTGLMSTADALGIGFGDGLGLGLGDFGGIGLGDPLGIADGIPGDSPTAPDGIGTTDGPMGDPLAIADALGMGDALAGDIQAVQDAAAAAAQEALAEGATPAEAAEAAAEAAQEAIAEAEATTDEPAGEEAGTEEATGEETTEETTEETAEETTEETENEGDETTSEETAEATEGENNGEVAGGEADAQAEGEQSDQGSENNQANQNQAFNPAGPPQSMMIQNPFSESISAQQTQALFSSSIQAFSSMGFDTGSASFGMAQDAMGDTMTTAALVSSSEQVLDAAREFLAILDTDQPDIYSLSGSGYTAATESVSMIIEDAIGAMVEARGNALIANDLLRILSINIKGFDDRIAENSFSSGVQRLANCNQELAYSYEVLNAILKEVQLSKDTGEVLTTAELNDILPAITAKARETSLSVSEKGDRASKDVLTFLTKRLQQKGIDKENLQAQVDTIFQEWHSNLGLSAPVNANQPLESDFADAM